MTGTGTDPGAGTGAGPGTGGGTGTGPGTGTGTGTGSGAGPGTVTVTVIRTCACNQCVCPPGRDKKHHFMIATLSLVLAAPIPAGPCDIYKAAGTPCVAAHSMVRALYAAYDGPLYLVKRADNLATSAIFAKGGYADADALRGSDTDADVDADTEAAEADAYYDAALM